MAYAPTKTIDFQSKYQHIKLSEDPFSHGDYVLLLDGAWQFASFSSFKYDESIMSIPLAAAPSINRVLICGGGDGMAVREALKFSDTQQIVLAEIDPVMIEIFKGEFAFLNNKALQDTDRLSIKIGDAIAYADSQPPESFDFITLDFPSPSKKNKQKHYENLYAPKVIEKFIRLLGSHGTISAQISVNTDVLAPVIRLLLAKGFRVWTYDTYYDNRGNHDSFLVACRRGLAQERDLPANLRFATKEHIESAFGQSQEITKDDLNHYRLFHHSERIDYESPV